MDFNKINHYSYSVDGGTTFHEIGGTYKLILEAYRGDYISIFCYNNREIDSEKPLNGYVDVEDFRYTYSRQGDDLNDAAFRTDRGAARGEPIVLTATDDETALWFAPADTTEFVEGDTMTAAAPGASTIAAPAAPGTYYLYAVHEDGSVSNPSRAALTVYCTVTEQRVEIEDYWWGVSNEGHFWVNTVEGASGGKILDNTLVGDVYYLGKMDLTDVNTVSLSMAHETGGVELGIYVDMEADVSAMTPATQVPDRNDARDRYLGTEYVTGGRKIASVQCGSTGSWTTYQTITAPVSEPVTGTHDVYLKVDSSSRYGGNLDCLTFARVGHRWADQWTTEGGFHWHTCTAEGCGAVRDRAACQTDSTGHCAVCGAVMLDVTQAQQFYRAEAGDVNWDEAVVYDLNGDQCIDLLDLTRIALYGT